MSASRATGSAKGTSLSAAIEPYRTRLGDDALRFSDALLVLAKHNAKQSSAFNQASPQDLEALKALAHWRHDAQRTLRRVKGARSDVQDRKLAERWLKAMIAALDLQRQALSLADPNQAADAARSAGKRIEEYFHLEVRLDQALA
jgi:hypothetical protein